ncbi:biotin transporter BioY [Phocicoccus pinnipedialis]|uniref:Biotin transporter n=1 Tax=Phocicoccus pinnipedialis TaxID=110845 RepID=A0A6V7R750_9BACL|nr:biotin transporter BioY [Jeotgalicoccus pinnipedialis]MBP1938873.1 biotin transport system substrate-specific component [Jeotgalicoccus pinnipedialis]CAD2073287.1 Biotin transporter BioY [Jeotgalicoccus pinnipedialis]
MKTKQLILVALFAALIAIGAQISIPIGPVPITLQAPMVILAGCLLGSRYGVLSVVVYILIGLIGIPVFAGGSGGLASLVSPSFGFIIGFLPLAFFAGLAARSESSLFMSGIIVTIGVLILFAIGLVYFMIIMNYVMVSPVSVTKAIMYTVTPFIVKDLIVAVCTLLFSRVLIQRGVHV